MVTSRRSKRERFALRHRSLDNRGRRSFALVVHSLRSVRIARTELDAWIADPKRTIEAAVWDAADGVRLRSTAASSYGPRVAKSTDGKLWFVTGEGVQIVDPRHLPFNKLPPPVHIEQITADHKIRWQNVLSDSSSDLRLPQLTRDLEIDYAALSLVAPEKINFKYKLEGYDATGKTRAIVAKRFIPIFLLLTITSA